jgi:hypothetical protein
VEGPFADTGHLSSRHPVVVDAVRDVGGRGSGAGGGVGSQNVESVSRFVVQNS